MLNVCQQCGTNRVDKIIDPEGPFAICPNCGHKHRFLQLPFLIVCGASGTGKSSVHQALRGKVMAAVLLDGDILWQPQFNKPDDNYRDFFETWLRLAKNISQSGRPVVLFNAGAIPDNVEVSVERRYFSETHYLALICDEQVLVERLRERPPWRKCDETFIKEQIRYNRWFNKNSRRTDPAIELLDTSTDALEMTVQKVKLWIKEKVS
jgi:hypothetical protein